MPYTEMFWLFGDDGVVHTLPEGQQEAGYVGTPAPRINTRDDPDDRKRFEALAVGGTDLPTDDAFGNEISHFVDCVESGREPLTSGRDNLGTIATVSAIYRSAERDGESRSWQWGLWFTTAVRRRIGSRTPTRNSSNWLGDRF